MSIEAHRCYVLTCDNCNYICDVDNAGYIVHFDTPDQAMESAAADGWGVTETGLLHCPTCIARHLCESDGHHMSPWWPCMCKGRIPDHALFGCGLFRFCERGCPHVENTTLAALPVTDEPTRPGR